ncbi:MAG: hypothetical protein BGO43_04105 [Gammaproteobacteria bacterium 39-13]|nr:methyltransferase domain-containing protein [Gammaproteobacteria bacterium]OJV94873.1 MAG: hypothetical protein BGO43_04105 [Gammaproteobacteria bacterium 39-13]
MIYRSSYDSLKLRGQDDPSTPRPWNIVDILSKSETRDKRLLDLGSGTGFKILPLQELYKEIICLEISKSMLNSASKNLYFNNISLIQGDNFNLPFKDNAFDVVVSMLSIWDPKEIHRVLTKDGFVLIELLGCEDKKDFKLFFGHDEQGLRGQYLQYDRETFIENIYKKFQAYFNHIVIQNEFWNTFYSPMGVLKLLSNTPIVRNFNYRKDKAALKKALETLSGPNGINITQNRMLLYAKDPK